MAAARETASGGFAGGGHAPAESLRGTPGLPRVFGLAMRRRGGCGGVGRHCSLRSLGACSGSGDAGVGGGFGRHRFARRVRGRGCDGFGRRRFTRRAGLVKNERLVTLPLGKRGCASPAALVAVPIIPATGEGAPVFSKKRRHQPFVFGHYWFSRVVAAPCFGHAPQSVG